MLFLKKKKQTPVELIIKTENTLMGDYLTYYRLYGAYLMKDILNDIMSYKDYKKMLRTLELNKASQEEKDAIFIDSTALAAKMPAYDKRYQTLLKLKGVRDEAFEMLN